MSKKEWTIIGVLGTAVVLVFSCLACVILGTLNNPSRSVNPTKTESAITVVPKATSLSTAIPTVVSLPTSSTTPTFRPTTTNIPVATVVFTVSSTPVQTNTPKPMVGVTKSPTTRPSVPTATRKPAANCDPSYPGVCIPPPPPDLDCKDVPYKKFRVLPPDPHQFDRDGNGIGCES